MSKLGLFLLVGAMSATAGCAQQWESVLDGNLYTRTHLNRYPVSITAVDDVYSTQNPRYVDSGMRKLVVHAAPVAGFTQPVRREFDFKVERCTRYWLAAQRASALSQDFELVIDHVEAVPGCTPTGGAHQPSSVTPAQVDPTRAIPTPKRN